MFEISAKYSIFYMLNNTYTLELDNRTKKQWDALLEQLKMSLDNRI